MLQAHKAAPNLMVKPIHGQMPTSEFGINHPQNSVATNTSGTMRGRCVAVGAFITNVFGDVEDMRMIDALFCVKSRYKVGKERGYAHPEDDL